MEQGLEWSIRPHQPFLLFSEKIGAALCQFLRLAKNLAKRQDRGFEHKTIADIAENKQQIVVNKNIL